MHHWHSAVDSGQSVRIVFVDSAKAFDRVDHNVLMSKMVALNLPDIVTHTLDAPIPATPASESEGWRRAVRLPTTDCWHASGLVPRPADICHTDSFLTAAVPDPQVY